MNPAKFLEHIYDIRRNCHLQEETFDDFIHNGGQSQALRQLIEYIYDEVTGGQNLPVLNEQADYSIYQSEEDLICSEDEVFESSCAKDVVLEQPAPPQFS